ncbi:MAG: glycosyltransferase family 2 protein [Bacteroidota bacterium]
MKVSIITVSFNAVDTIEDTIQSVINQKYPDLEYIIIDGASKDGTVELVDKYKKQIDKVISEKDEGIYDAMNKGIRSSSGDIIGILNADDIYQNNEVIERIVKEFKESDSDAVYGDLVYVKKNDLESVIRNWKSNVFERRNFLKGWMPPHPTFFLKRKHYLKYGMYDTRFKISADYELMLRMLYKEHLSASYFPNLVTRMRVGGESNASIKQRIKANIEDRKAWRINDIRPKPFTLLRKPLSKIKQYWS